MVLFLRSCSDCDGHHYNCKFYQVRRCIPIEPWCGGDASLEERIEELTAEGKEVSQGKLWGNECQFYIDNATICMIPLGEDAYLQVEFAHEEDSLAELTRVSSGFSLIIERER